MKIIEIESGMFQYFIHFQCFDSKNQTPPITFKKFFNGKIKKSVDIQSEQRKTKVQFIDKLEIKTFHTWQFAYKQARKDIWQQAARDRVRFAERINKLSKIISPILKKKLETQILIMYYEDKKSKK